MTLLELANEAIRHDALASQAARAGDAALAAELKRKARDFRGKADARKAKDRAVDSQRTDC